MSSAKIFKNKTVDAEVLLNCGDEGKHNCLKLSRALITLVPEINLAKTIKSVGTGKKFCVTGRAIVDFMRNH